MNTSKPEIVHTLPAGTDLGNLDGVKVGDEMVTVRGAENGRGLTVNTTVFTVTEVLDWVVRVRSPKSGARAGWLRANGGGCPYAMHDQNVMRFYFSANPEHIATAKRKAKEEKERAERQKRERDALLTYLKPLGEELGDGDVEDDYAGQTYYRASAANALADKLTREQMQTLAGWLGVKLG